jgi:hypothetical protein
MDNFIVAAIVLPFIIIIWGLVGFLGYMIYQTIKEGPPWL